jgi:hypothetical protein
MESLIPNARNTLTDIHGGQRSAVFESLYSNTRYALGDSDRGKSIITNERITFDIRHTFWYY